MTTSAPTKPASGDMSATHSKHQARSLLDAAILRRAAVDSFVKLDPRWMARNPVMFVVEVGSVLTTIVWLRDIGSSASPFCHPYRRSGSFSSHQPQSL